ncbi:glycine--tRNA ligase subunit beta [Bartonella sp. DGB1]|uniref:glycine--tRNA ligase subunit beta n=1 Tax=Bartonella sp. DGB1 TaxID=3239807 RepID=UPI0035231F8B
MSDLLVELYSEEIPASLQQDAACQLQKKLTDSLVEHGLSYQTAQIFYTPRRLTLFIHNLSNHTAKRIEEKKGPSTKAPKSAIDGFIRSNGLQSIEEATIKTDPKKGSYYCATITYPSQPAKEIIAQILPEIIKNFSWGKSMRWGSNSISLNSLKWIRPLRSILCILSDNDQSEIVNFKVEDIASDNLTYGHPFLGQSQAIAVNNFEEYQDNLAKQKVILDVNQRKNIIITDAKNIAFAKQLKIVEDQNLLDEIAGLVEYPVVFLGEFDPKFLTMPAEITRLTIKVHQKSFVTYQGDDINNLSNHFIIVANILPTDKGEKIITGNSKVVNARLSDALYFWQKDQEPLTNIENSTIIAERFNLDLSKPLDQRLAKLISLNVIFHSSLGTLGDRILRIIKMSSYIAPLLDADKNLVVRAAILCKADLQTEIVGEFPELQGIMGGKYAKLQGETDAVASAISDHYRPQGPNDYVPTSAVTASLSLADKIDILCSFWLINEKPTGSRDPFALRRAALGVIRILLTQKKYINLLPILRHSLSNIAKDLQLTKAPDIEKTADDLLKFIQERFKIILLSEGKKIDLIDALMLKENDDLYLIAGRIDELAKWLINNPNVKNSLYRIYNILNEQKLSNDLTLPNIDNFTHNAEKELYNKLLEVTKRINNLNKYDHLLILEALADLSPAIDNFFENIFINDPNPTIKNNRVILLQYIWNIAKSVADFSKIIK